MKMLCMANSFRHGGRCLGGILIDNNNQVVKDNNKTVWVRPISKTDRSQIPESLSKHISLLDIVEFSCTTMDGVFNNFQRENVVLDENIPIVKIGEYPRKNIYSLIDNYDYDVIFGNKGKAIPEDKACTISRTLILIRIVNYEINETPRHDYGFHTKKNLVFKFNNNIYDLPITDPYFINAYDKNKSILSTTEKIFITLSLGAPYNGWCFKLIAGVIIP
jgi:hypothetical protein